MRHTCFHKPKDFTVEYLKGMGWGLFQDGLHIRSCFLCPFCYQVLRAENEVTITEVKEEVKEEVSNES